MLLEVVDVEGKAHYLIIENKVKVLPQRGQAKRYRKRDEVKVAEIQWWDFTRYILALEKYPKYTL